VGTTEAAALLRYFGLKAQVVDFDAAPPSGAAAGQPGDATAASNRPGEAAAAVEMHMRVECDSCGCCPIVGPRFKSSVLPNFDLCSDCHARQSCGPAAPFQRMMAARGESAHGADAAVHLSRTWALPAFPLSIVRGHTLPWGCTLHSMSR
jgi:hypothetical protein